MNRIFFDLDGTLAEWKQSSSRADLYEQGYFLSLRPNQSLLNAAIRLQQDYDVFILGAVLKDSLFAFDEKNAWLDKHFPITKDHRIFVNEGQPKNEGLPGGIMANDILVDDYSVNLFQWAQYGRGIKALNGINGTKGTWRGPAVRTDWPAELIAATIITTAKNENLLQEGVTY